MHAFYHTSQPHDKPQQSHNLSFGLLLRTGKYILVTMFLILHVLYLVPLLLAFILACITEKDTWYLPYLKWLTSLAAIPLALPLYAIASCFFFYAGANAVPTYICVITGVISLGIALYLGYRLIDIFRYLIERLKR